MSFEQDISVRVREQWKPGTMASWCFAASWGPHLGESD